MIKHLFTKKTGLMSFLGLALILSSCAGTASPPVLDSQATTKPSLPDALQFTEGERYSLKDLLNTASGTQKLTWDTTSNDILTLGSDWNIVAQKVGQTKLRFLQANDQKLLHEISITVIAATSLNSQEQQLLNLLNLARQQGATCGDKYYPATTPLTPNARLSQAAQKHADDMATKDYFSHISQDGTTLGARITATGYRWTVVAENIAAGQTSPESVVKSWLSSMGHCKTIMNPALKHVGFGYATNEASYYNRYWVNDFGSP